MANIEIDGIKIHARDGAMLIEAADEVGIPIPRFCYHKKLSVAANCRMCLVDVDKAAKPLPACATPVTEGMKVWTKSARALEAQQGVMEFLLINHPLDCPICDQGGECDLQDLAVGYGASQSRYVELKRVIRDKDIGPLIATEMTRCIHCTRCVRFGDEIGGMKELGATGRGEHMEIGTYVAQTVSSEMSGNMIDLCPVGALTSKPFRFAARAWEMQRRPLIAAHDCVGTHLSVDIVQREVKRALPREFEEINETWCSDRDRFSYSGLNSRERLLAPQVRRAGEWQQVDWTSAFESVVSALKPILLAGGARHIGVLVSPNATLEEMYLAQKWLRGLGGHNIDHRLREQDFSDQDLQPLAPGLGLPIADLEKLDAVLVIGGNIRKEQPIINHRLRKAALRGGRVMFINSVDYSLNYRATQRLLGTPAQVERHVVAVAQALLQDTGAAAPAGWEALAAHVEINDAHRAMARTLRSGNKRAVLLGSAALHHPAGATLRAAAQLIAQHSGATYGVLSDGANGAGGWLAGAVPHRGPHGQPLPTAGLHARAMLEQGLKAWVVIGAEPELDCANSSAALAALNQAECVVMLTPYVTETMRRYAHILLPIAPWSETSGTFINTEGRTQSFAAALNAKGEARPAWKVLRVLGNAFDLPGFEQLSSEEVRDELTRLPSASLAPAWRCPTALRPLEQSLTRLADVPAYAVDGVVRRAEALQRTPDALSARALRVHPHTAQHCRLVDGEFAAVQQRGTLINLPVAYDETVPENCILVAAALPDTVGLGADGEVIEVEPAPAARKVVNHA